MAQKNVREVPSRRGYWQEQIQRAYKRYEIFYRNGGQIVDRYRLERENSGTDQYKDRYNILYSTTETTKPSLYAQTPKVEAVKRHKDREDETVNAATLMYENVVQYAMEDIDFDDVMNNVVEDYILPGLGQAWVEYVPTIEQERGEDGKPVEGAEYVAFEGLNVSYVHYRDFLTGFGRVWAEVPWVARRIYFDKAKATKRFGPEKANELTYSYRPNEDGSTAKADSGGGDQAIIHEIWDKTTRTAIWYSDDYAPDVLDVIADPLKLENFFPCPRPLRAVSNTRTMVPKSFFAEYKAQAEELDALTEKIRYLTQALRVIGVYDGANPTLGTLLTGAGNKMVSVENWAQFAGSGGIQGAIQWVSVQEIATVLTELFKQREIVKNEIYEITGFSDIQRGVSKASETLGAQEIKNQWASGRLRSLQKEVQRFCRDLIRIMGEIVCEQFSEESLAMYAGFTPPPITDEEQAAAAAYAASQMTPASGQPPAPQMPKPPPTMQVVAIKQFQAVVKLLKNERKRCAVIGIETDSTIQPDEAQERQDRLDFLGKIGAFLQQAGPMALQFPEMRGLLGSIMMFAVRTFRASRSIEKDFEDFQKKLAAAPPTPPPGKEGGGDSAGDTAKVQAEMQMETQRLTAESQRVQAENATKQSKIASDERTAQMKMQQDHEFRMAEIALKNRELALREREVVVKERELGIQAAEAETNRVVSEHEAALAAADMEHVHEQSLRDGDRADEQLEADQTNADADRAAQSAPDSENGA